MVRAQSGERLANGAQRERIRECEQKRSIRLEKKNNAALPVEKISDQDAVRSRGRDLYAEGSIAGDRISEDDEVLGAGGAEIA
jgi:hypothetical protein